VQRPPKRLRNPAGHQNTPRTDPSTRVRVTHRRRQLGSRRSVQAYGRRTSRGWRDSDQPDDENTYYSDQLPPIQSPTSNRFYAATDRRVPRARDASFGPDEPAGPIVRSAS
jgi:hypothetical protein